MGRAGRGGGRGAEGGVASGGGTGRGIPAVSALRRRVTVIWVLEGARASKELPSVCESVECEECDEAESSAAAAVASSATHCRNSMASFQPLTVASRTAMPQVMAGSPNSAIPIAKDMILPRSQVGTMARATAIGTRCKATRILPALGESGGETGDNVVLQRSHESARSPISVWIGKPCLASRSTLTFFSVAVASSTASAAVRSSSSSV